MVQNGGEYLRLGSLPGPYPLRAMVKLVYPEGPDTKLFRIGPKSLIIMVFKLYFLNNQVPGPSG